MSVEFKDPTSSSEVIDIVSTPSSSATQWNPEIGAETTNLTSNLGLNLESQNILQNEAAAILRRCFPLHA